MSKFAMSVVCDVCGRHRNKYKDHSACAALRKKRFGSSSESRRGNARLTESKIRFLVEQVRRREEEGSW